jgi:hypothetical protein
MADEPPGMSDPPQVVEITVEWPSDGRGLAGSGSGRRRALAICAAAVIAVAGAIVIAGLLSSSPGRTTAGLASQGALKCENGTTMNFFFAYRPPHTAPRAKRGACP